jgi:hypothetical protein
MTNSSRHRLWSAAIVLLASAGCTEKTTFIPLSPSVLKERVIEAAKTYPYKFDMTLNSGRWGEGFSTQIVEASLQNPLLLIDWTSATNRIIVTIHRTGDVVGTGDDINVTRHTCFIPVAIYSGGVGALLTAPQSQPTCPVVLSNATNEKPKFLDLRDLPLGGYSFVVTNEGPGNEALSLFYFDE